MGNRIFETGNSMRTAMANRIASAEQAAVNPKVKPKPKTPAPVQSAPSLPKPQQKYVDARAAAIAKQQAADRAAIIERNKKMSLRNKM